MTTLYSHAIRVLTCQGCGAPIDASLEGGQVRCSYCSATNVVHRRDESADRARAQEALQSPDSESERFAKLRMQDQGPTPLPESLRPWLNGSALDRAFLAAAVSSYIHCFYSTTRQHSTLGYKGPVGFENVPTALDEAGRRPSS